MFLMSRSGIPNTLREGRKMRDPGNEVTYLLILIGPMRTLEAGGERGWLLFKPKDNYGKLFVVVKLMGCRIRKITINFAIFSPEIA